MERPRSRTRTQTTTTIPSDDDSAVSWDELNDVVNHARRRSVQSLSSNDGTSSSLSQRFRGNNNNNNNKPLPTIYASGSSTREFNVNDSSGNLDFDPQVDLNGVQQDSSNNAKAAAAQDNFTPTRITPSRGMNNNKTNHAAAAGGGGGGREENAEWDDLQDEIATAMKQSMFLTASNVDVVGGGEEPPDMVDEDAPWNCPACTFLNENPLHLVCAVCGTAKVVVAQPTLNTSTSFNGGGGGGDYPSRDYYNNSGRGMEMGGLNNSLNSFHNGGMGMGGSFTNNNSSSFNRKGSADDLVNSFSSGGGGRGGSGRYLDRRNSDFSNEPYNNNFRSSTNSRSSEQQHGGGGRNNSGSGSGRGGDRDRRPTINGYDINDEYPHRSSHKSSMSREGGGDYNNSRGGGGGGRRRKGVRRGHHRSSRGEEYRDSLRSSQRSFDQHDDRSSIIDDDSFGSFHSQQDLHYRDYKHSRHGRGGGGGGRSSRSHGDSREERKRYSQSVSGGGSSSRYRDSDDMSRASRRSTRSGRSKNKKKNDYRRSTSHVDNYNGSRGGGGGYGGYNDDYSDNDHSEGPLGGKIEADSDSEPSDLSEPEESDPGDEGTIYRDDKTTRTMKTIKTLKVPEGEVTIIYTDVQGSTSLWEADPLAMKKATDIHDSVIRKCYADHGGYEITTEGDAFNLSFQHPADAIGFALKAQLALYRAKWPEGILNHPDGCDNEKKKFRGFRVRMGMHHGPTTSDTHKTTGRTTYQGEAVNIAKAIEKMSHGGQILTTVDTWTAVSGMAEQFLGSPQVMDCGEHLLYDPKKENAMGSKKKTKRIFSKRIVQLVPNSLSYDFFAARGGQEVKEGETPPRVCGRVFPPLLSHGQLSTSFLNAPYIGNKVAMVFVYTDKMENVTDKERKKNYKILAKYVRSHLMRLSPPGYECQEDKGSWMLAFDRIENGIKFGLDLKEDVLKNADLFGDVDKERAFRVGIHWGPFLSMGPHTVSGHADYFGPIVNRAARVAAQCEPGQVCVGVPMGDGEEPPDPGPSVDVDVLGVKQLKGISIEMAIFACKKRTEDKAKEEDT